MNKYVISLGGNALGNNAEKQLKLLKEVAKPIVSLIKQGHQVAIVHGNGPQVGMINKAFGNENVPNMPFPECGAMSQGYIGYHIQNAITNELIKNNINKNVTTIITQVVVDKSDPLFGNPTKPIGSFYTKEQADIIAKETGYIFKEDAGRGYRRVVASPLPVDIVEKESIINLVNSGSVVICAGGGGIPVYIDENSNYQGIAAVIDKDFASSKVAELIDADYLVILTAVDNVCINFNTPNQVKLTTTTVNELNEYIKQNYFAKGSMLPKVQACINFLNNKPNKTAIISSLEKANLAFLEKAGTIIKK